jgi:Cd2+/Zn2+-exporting ATPase
MLSGDSSAAAREAAAEAGMDRVYGELLPHEKVERFEELAAETKSLNPRGRIVFVGDGVNDAPVLARADVGIAMGALGSDAAVEAADVVLMNDDPCSVAEAVSISRRTISIVRQNIVFSFAVKFCFLVLGAFGAASLWEAVFADVGVALLATANAVRVLRVRNKKV